MILQVVMNCCIINSVRLIFVCPSLFSPSCMGWGHFSTIFCLAQLFLAQLYVGQVNLLVNKIKHFILRTNHIWMKPISIGSAFYCTITQIHKEMSKSRLVAAADERVTNMSLGVGRWAAAADKHILILLFFKCDNFFSECSFSNLFALMCFLCINMSIPYYNLCVSIVTTFCKKIESCT
jgi:hypothetical protein